METAKSWPIPTPADILRAGAHSFTVGSKVIGPLILSVTPSWTTWTHIQQMPTELLLCAKHFSSGGGGQEQWGGFSAESNNQVPSLRGMPGLHWEEERNHRSRTGIRPGIVPTHRAHSEPGQDGSRDMKGGVKCRYRTWSTSKALL